MSSKPRPQNSKLRARNFLPGTLLTVLVTLLLIFNCTNPPPAIETWQQVLSPTGDDSGDGFGAK